MVKVLDWMVRGKISHRAVYRFYEYGTLIGLVLTVGIVIGAKVVGFRPTPSEATWMSRGLFVTLLLGWYFLVREPELMVRVEQARSVRTQKLLLMRLFLGFMVNGCFLAFFTIWLQEKVDLALVATGMVCFIWGYVLYHRALANGDIPQPAMAYWGTISLINVASLAVSIQAGGWSITTAQLACWSGGSTSVLLAVLWRSRGKVAWKASLLDRACIGVSLLAILVWLASGSSSLALGALAVAMSAACTPLVVSAAAGKESALPLAPCALGGLTGLFSVASWSTWEVWVIPVIGAVSFGAAFLFAAVVKQRTSLEPS